MAVEYTSFLMGPQGALRPVVTHLSPEIGVHLAAGISGVKTVEFMP